MSCISHEVQLRGKRFSGHIGSTITRSDCSCFELDAAAWVP